MLRGHIPQRWFGKYCILLHTVGRRTGAVRVSPLVFVRDGQDYAVVASWGGSDTHPHWFLNLRANPHALVEDHGRTYAVLAEVVEDDASYDRLWRQFVAIYSAYELYKQRTVRRIPIVLLRAQAPGAPQAGATNG
jgi:deazaflavin-dependent oxidoreductase (nitroreductase family)